jgi:sugar phosphate isomerase/epimerase
MDFGISTRCFGTTRLSRELLERLRRAEFGHIEIHAALPAFDYRVRSLNREVSQWFRDNEMAPPSLHLPFEEDILAARHIERQRALDEIKRCLELSDLMPLKYAVLHIGTTGQAYNPVQFEHAYAVLSTIQSFAGLRVLIETLDNQIATFERISEFKAASQIAGVGICYDTGHGDLDGPTDAIHANDNDGNNDDHLWPFEGSRNWPALVERLVLSSFEGPIILEGSNEQLERATSARSRLRDLWDDARNSIEEFRLRHKLPQPKQEEDE